MRSSLIYAILIVGISHVVFGVNYEGYKVYKIQPTSEVENESIQTLQKLGFDFWSKNNKVGNPVVLMSQPNLQKFLEHYLNVKNISFEILIENVESTIQKEKEYHKNKPTLKSSGGISFDKYYRHDEINAYLQQLAEDYPETVTLDTLGQSYEKREMNLIRISSGPSDPPKPVIFIDAGIHAREWVAPAVALYLINQLVENPENSNLYENVDWIILPSLNPDGYEYSWDVDRLWRKTVSHGTRCDGCDANRNFDFHWMETGASDNECDETYAGKNAFSETETQNLSDYLNKTDNIQAYLTLHSYGQYLLYPWGYEDVLCDNWQELDDLGHAMDDAISAVRGTRYTVGGSTATLYAAAGASDDYAMGVEGITIVYTMELPGGGSYGFDLPPEELEAVVEETFEGLKVFGNYVAENRK